MKYLFEDMDVCDVKSDMAMENHPFATDEDKKGFEQIKMLLHGKEVLEIERSLAEADVKQDVLDKIEKLYKDLKIAIKVMKRISART